MLGSGEMRSNLPDTCAVVEELLSGNGMGTSLEKLPFGHSLQARAEHFNFIFGTEKMHERGILWERFFRAWGACMSGGSVL
jgi:hypothetical protein